MRVIAQTTIPIDNITLATREPTTMDHIPTCSLFDDVVWGLLHRLQYRLSPSHWPPENLPLWTISLPVLCSTTSYESYCTDYNTDRHHHTGHQRTYYYGPYPYLFFVRRRRMRLIAQTTIKIITITLATREPTTMDRIPICSCSTTSYESYCTDYNTDRHHHTGHLRTYHYGTYPYLFFVRRRRMRVIAQNTIPIDTITLATREPTTMDHIPTCSLFDDVV